MVQAIKFIKKNHQECFWKKRKQNFLPFFGLSWKKLPGKMLEWDPASSCLEILNPSQNIFGQKKNSEMWKKNLKLLSKSGNSSLKS